MAQIYGQLQNAQLENLSADPSTSVAGRFYLNTATGTVVVDDGTAKRALLRNDGKAVFGTDATAANNIRFHHAGVAMLQFVPGNDTTAENSVATSLAQVGFRATNLPAAPAVGNVGRIYFNTATSGLQVDTGTVFLQFATLTGTETLTNKTLSGAAADLINYADQSATPATPASGVTKVYTKSGSLYKVASDGVETLVGAGGNTTNTILRSGNYTATATDGYALISASSGAITVTLPAASSNNGVKLTFQKGDTSFNAISLGSVTTLNTYLESVVLISINSAWTVADRNIPLTWTAFTMNITAGTTAPTKPTTKAETARWRRNGGNIEIDYSLAVASASGAANGSGVYYYGGPSGLPNFDVANKANATEPYVGGGHLRDQGNRAMIMVTLYDATRVSLIGKYSGLNSSGASVTDFAQNSGTFGLANAAPYQYSFLASIPVVGWNT